MAVHLRRITGALPFPPIARLATAALVAGSLAGCGQNEAPDDGPAPAPPVVRVLPAQQAIAGAEVRKLDPASLNRAEIVEVVGNGPQCIFRYTRAGKPVVVAALGTGGSPQAGVVKLNGHLVPLRADTPAGEAGPVRLALVADPVRIEIQPVQAGGDLPQPGGSQVEADLVFQVGQSLTVGYGGYLECRQQAPGPVHRP